MGFMEFIVIGLFVMFFLFILISNMSRYAQRKDYHAHVQRMSSELPGKFLCPKCNMPMVLGFLPDKQEVGCRVLNWVDGPIAGSEENVRFPSERCIPVGAYRCSGCGFLEFFARPDLIDRMRKPSA